MIYSDSAPIPLNGRVGSFNDWVNSSTPEQREQFVEALFQMINAVNSENATSFVDWSEYIKNNSSVAYETLKGLDPEVRSLVMHGIGDMFSSINKNVKSTPKKLWNDTLKKFKDKTKQEE